MAFNIWVTKFIQYFGNEKSVALKREVDDGHLGLFIVGAGGVHRGAIEIDPADIPALIAALEKAREIAEQWAAESEGAS